MKKLLLLSFVFLGLVGCKKEEKFSDKPVVKIGVIVPMTGSMSLWGETISKGINIVLKENKDTKYTYKVIIEDNLLDIKKTKMAIDKLVNVDDVDVVISVFSHPAEVINTVIKGKDILHFGIHWSNVVIDNPNSFNHWTNLEEEIDILSEFIIKNDYKKVGFIAGNHPAYVSAEKLLRQKNIKLTDTRYFNFGERDFAPIISQLENENVDSYLILSFDPEYSIILRKLNEMVEGKDVFGLGTVEDVSPKTISTIKSGYCTGKEYVLPKYEKSLNGDVMFGTPVAYDIMKTIIFGFESNFEKGKDINVISNFLKNSKIETVYGETSISKDKLITIPSVIKKVKNGKVEVLRN